VSSSVLTGLQSEILKCFGKVEDKHNRIDPFHKAVFCGTEISNRASPKHRASQRQLKIL